MKQFMQRSGLYLAPGHFQLSAAHLTINTHSKGGGHVVPVLSRHAVSPDFLCIRPDFHARFLIK
jgi:hypothetical protein